MDPELLQMSSTAEMQAERLSPDEIDAVLRDHPIVYLPLGTLEFHGSHLPIGLDALNAHGVCLEAARRSGGIVLPPVYQGFGGGHGHYPWTVMMAEGNGIRAHLESTIGRLEDFGVKVAVIFSGHFATEQVELINDIAVAWNSAGAHSLVVVAAAVDQLPDSPLQPDHAGEFESTLLAGIAPELVHLEKLPPVNQEPSVDPDGDPYGNQRHDKRHVLWGVFGPDPRKADLSAGSALVELFGGWLAEKSAGALTDISANEESTFTRPALS
jgi:creatinine amidohydrolase